MKRLREQLKEGVFSPVYLFYGPEKYLIEVYVKRYIDKIFVGGDTMMNYDKFDQESKDMDAVLSSLETLPFFASKRVVVLENMGFFETKNKNRQEALVAKLEEVKDSVLCIVIEDKIDKRAKLYKYADKTGLCCEFHFLEENELVRYIMGEMKKFDIAISLEVGRYFIETVGYELNTVNIELRKLVDFLGEHKQVEKKDIDEINTKHIEAKIFDLVDALGNKNKQLAFGLLRDMLDVKEPIQRIFVMITRQFTLIYQVKLHMEKKSSSDQIAKEVGVPPFVLRKLTGQAGKFDKKDIKRLLLELHDMEYASRTGQMDLETGVEMMILGL
ncbi:MAG: DNA polymerase III subunit delta [Vallitaleaceae bacterium]|nr:DNA polymerase III subunit delta [Vallitaleaceae bacterium]